jgi:hypothetical protein
MAAILDDSEKEILASTGIPPIFAIYLKEKSRLLGVAFALRTTSPVQRYLMPAAPKPSSVKVKTGNWGFTKGVIPIEASLGKTLRIDHVWRLIPRLAGELPAKDSGVISEVLHTVSLQEVLAGINGQEFKLIGTVQDIQDSGRITIMASRKAPLNSEIIFSIALTEAKPRVQEQCKIDFEKITVKLPAREPRPTWWLDAWGDFDRSLDNYYPAQFKSAQDAEFRDIYVYGVADENNVVLPITGDQDLLWISIPTKLHESLLKDFEEVINTFEEGGVEKIYRARIALHLKMGGQPEEAENSIRNNSIAGLGSVSTHESFVIDEVNTSFSHSGVNHIRDLIQHASENHNPAKSSPLDVPAVHVWRDKISRTRNENEMIQFITHENYPQENIVNVNPRWDMNKWAAVITQQLQLKLPVPVVTLDAYKQHQTKSRSFGNLIGWVKKKDIPT